MTLSVSACLISSPSNIPALESQVCWWGCFQLAAQSLTKQEMNSQQNACQTTITDGMWLQGLVSARTAGSHGCGPASVKRSSAVVFSLCLLQLQLPSTQQHSMPMNDDLAQGVTTLWHSIKLALHINQTD